MSGLEMTPGPGRGTGARAEVPVVLVHGMWHGSWCWSLVTVELAARGVMSVAVDLDGHGLKARPPHSRWGRPMDAETFATEPSPVAGVTALSAAATLADQIRRIGAGRPCLVVAHSMGGVVATAAAEAAPELFAGLVYVSAYAPVSGQPAAAYAMSKENAGVRLDGLLKGDPRKIGGLRIDPQDVSKHDPIRQTLYNDLDADTATAAICLLSTDGPAGIPATAFEVTRARYGAIPHAYVVCTRDQMVRPALQRRLIREIDAMSARPTVVTELDSSHSPFLSQPAALADFIASLERAGGPLSPAR
ncbi:MAG TPA: alpha/beta hydrolase [Trebonia sp.]|nr:alpha/beta hydrolase [Trebonia sp.]